MDRVYALRASLRAGPNPGRFIRDVRAEPDGKIAQMKMAAVSHLADF
jgi:hypothetical protein